MPAKCVRILLKLHIVSQSTEFRLKQSSNYVLSTQSNIINTHTVRERQRERERERDRETERERIGLILREIYPGSIFERNIIENHEISETLLAELKKKKEIISDKEFII